MTTGPPPAWRLPEGVNAPLWEYAHSDWLAESEDSYFLDHPMFREDARWVLNRFREPAPLIDLGSGVGRLAVAFARRGFPVAAVDLSHAMLLKAREKAATQGGTVACVTANLTRLGCFPDATFTYALSMFSTLGMIRTPATRRRALAEAARLLRPGGRLALHAHNLWLNLATSQGRAWLTRQVVPWVRRDPSLGDRRMTYRGIPNMEVHLYRWPELRRDLSDAGFRIDEVQAIDTVTAQPIARPWLARDLRAGGWFVLAARP